MININHSDCVKWCIEYRAKHDAEPEKYPLFDSCCTDAPYELGFMGKKWDNTGVAFAPETWVAIFNILKDGAHIVAFSGSRTYHRMAVAIEDAGFEIRDQLAWIYASGFPKSHDISKAIDRANGVEREVKRVKVSKQQMMMRDGENERPWQNEAIKNGYHELAGDTPASQAAKKWDGWGTALKPAWEPICLARKPISEKNIAANVLKHGTGAINIDATRIENNEYNPEAVQRQQKSDGWVQFASSGFIGKEIPTYNSKGRFPANIIHDGSDEVLAGFPETGAAKAAPRGGTNANPMDWGQGRTDGEECKGHDDNGGSAARFFYSAKAGPLDRLGSKHPTIKPIDLMRWLCKLITPTGGHILEPFAGSGSTGIAAMADGFDCTMIDMEADHVADIERKIAHLKGEGQSSINMHKEHKAEKLDSLGGLFE